jgi:hypothetical protein
MSIESSVYSKQPAIGAARLAEIGGDGNWELRAYVPDEPVFGSVEDAEAPLFESHLVLIGWPRQDAETTAMVDEALRRHDKAAVDGLGQAGKVAWCELSCERYDYEQSWEDCPDERDEFEESFPPEDLERLRTARTRYFLRCGTRPPQNGKLLSEVAALLRDATEGFLDEG